MTSATVVATIILASIMATVAATTDVYHHDIIAFQISPIHNHRRRCRFISSSRTNDEPRILLRRHLDEDSVGGLQLRRPHSRLGVSFAPLKLLHQRSIAAATSSSIQLYHSRQQYNTDAVEEEEEENTSATHTTTDATSPTLELLQKKWMFQNKYPIAYEVARLSVSPEDIENGMMTMEDDDEEVPILLLNGFGVGSFHQHRLMRQLLLQHEEYCQQQQQQQQIDHETQQHQQLQQPQQSQQQQRPRRQRLVVYGIDYLGQGNSWPITCNGVGTSEDELNLGYSADVWLDQLKDFIDEVVLSSSSSSSSLTASSLPSAATETFPSSSSSSSNPNQKKVHLIGNSVGGYLATILTHRHPHSISSLTLLNATPVWGLNLPGWDGRLPPPPLPKYVGGQMFDLIRNPNVINMYLQTAYVHPEAYDGTYEDCFYGSDGWKEDDTSNSDRRIALGEKIRACTEGKGGHAAFASILWSAPASEWINVGTRCATPVDFYSTLQNVPVDVLLLFGANDSWCTPAIAKRMHTTLSKRNNESTTTNDGRDLVPLANRYVSLENVGHCPNHEAPTSVAKVVLPWIRAPSSSSSATANVNGEQQQQNRCNVPLVVPDGSDETQEPWGAVRAYEVSLDESKELGVMDRIVSSMVG